MGFNENFFLLKCRLMELHGTKFQPYTFPIFCWQKKYFWKSDPPKSCALGRRTTIVEINITAVMRAPSTFYFCPIR